MTGGTATGSFLTIAGNGSGGAGEAGESGASGSPGASGAAAPPAWATAPDRQRRPTPFASVIRAPPAPG